MNPKRSLFFDIVTSGLNDRFSDIQSITRIHKFIAYAKYEVPLPTSIDNKSSMHEPCEEYIEGINSYSPLSSPFYCRSLYDNFMRDMTVKVNMNEIFGYSIP